MKVSTSKSPVKRERTKKEDTSVFYGVDAVVNLVIQFLNQTNKIVYACVDRTRPILILDNLVLKKAFEDAKRRGVKFMYITEVTKDNLIYCKQLTKITHELRHLEGIKGNFYISESGYLAPVTLHEKGKPSSQIIYSNVNEIIEHQKYVFDSFWNKAIPAEQRIKEIEEGVTRYEIKLIREKDEIVNEIVRINQSSNEISICTTAGGLQFARNHLVEVIRHLQDRQKNGEHKGIRYISSINNDNLELAKILIDYGAQVRHINNLPPMSFGVSDKEFGATMENLDERNAIQSLLVTNEPLYIKHFVSIFEELWKNGIDAADRIRDIEEGRDLADIEIIPNPKEGIARAWNIIKSAREEVSVVFSSPNALLRQIEMGGLKLLKDVSERCGARVRLLIPSDSNKHTLSSISGKLKSQCPLVDVRYMEKSLYTRITIVLADRKECTITELKDDTKDNSYGAAGLSTYSKSKSIVSSYVSIFESLWKQTELYEQLKVHDKMQKDFINMAAHELRTPIQPILGLSEDLLSRKGNIEQYHISLDTISRNAKRLRRLTENILDVTKIESHTLKLHKEKVNINEELRNVINDVKSQIHNPDKLRIVLLEPKNPVYVEADKIRIYQTMVNLLTNAIKFTKEGIISISADVKDNNNELIISVKDSGEGIHPVIMPRLFTKFTTRSDTGTGLGLFISKNIVETHSGRIWAENNSDGKGATFTFTLPLSVPH